MLFLSQVIYMKEKNSDYTNTFSQDPINYDQEVYIKLPHGLETKQEGEYVDCLNSEL